VSTPVEIAEVALTVNGAEHHATVSVRQTLADFLREELRLTGTHLGCEHGVCGACTVLLDGRAVRACLLYAVQADGKSITTVEGLAEDDRMHPLQEAFWAEHALQCGFCTPGFLISAAELLAENPDPTEAEITDTITGNLCRCTGYATIVRAVKAAAAANRAAASEGAPNS
jgi:aerobic carbon-monoxide dehydrogenase small subunit